MGIEAEFDSNQNQDNLWLVAHIEVKEEIIIGKPDGRKNRLV